MERCEMETTITYDMEEKVAHIFSAIRRDQRRIEKMGFKATYGTPDRGLGYIVPLNRLKWRVTSGVPSKRKGNLIGLQKHRSMQQTTTGKAND